MSKIIPGVPESITRADYTRLVESVGFTASNLFMLEFHPDSIRATVAALDADGNRILTTDGLLKHEVEIPVDKLNGGAK